MIQFLYRIYRVSYVLHMLWLEFNFGFSVVFQSRFRVNLFCFQLTIMILKQGKIKVKLVSK